MDGLTDQDLVNQMRTKRKVFSQEKSGSSEMDGQANNLKLELSQVEAVLEEVLVLAIFLSWEILMIRLAQPAPLNRPEPQHLLVFSGQLEVSPKTKVQSWLLTIQSTMPMTNGVMWAW